MKKTKAENLLGTVFNELSLVEYIERKNNDQYYFVECKNGHRYRSCIRILKRGGFCKFCRFGCKHHSWKGCGELSLEKFNRYRTNAEKRGIDFSLTVEEAWGVYEKQSRICALSGLPIHFSSHSKNINKGSSASLDRIDSSKGYSIDNIQWVHKSLNIIKSSYPNLFFIEICNLVSLKNPCSPDPEKILEKSSSFMSVTDKKMT